MHVYARFSNVGFLLQVFQLKSSMDFLSLLCLIIPLSFHPLWFDIWWRETIQFSPVSFYFFLRILHFPYEDTKVVIRLNVQIYIYFYAYYSKYGTMKTRPI